jgi:uncharacterized Zn-finger protein
MTRAENTALFHEIAGAGYCVHPVLLHGATVNVATGELSHTTFRIPCKDRRAVVCPSCSYLYKADAWILVASGLNGGKGLGEEVGRHPRVFATLTAPSFGPVHRLLASGDCHPRARQARCAHGLPTTCQDGHVELDAVLGTPLCPECFDYVGAVLWNATASRLWHRTMVRLRQAVAATQRLSESQLLEVARLNYLKVAEFQHRGLVHFHAIIRADGPDGPSSEPPEWLTPELLGAELQRLARAVAFRGAARRQFRWGTQFEVHSVTAGDDDGQRVAAYLAKYAVKTTDGTAAFARRFERRSRIEKALVSPHLRQLALSAWDLGGRPDLQELRLRHHAHTFGFTGQLITKSQGYSTTFAALRRARADHMASTSEDRNEVVGTFAYAGRGYSDPRGEEIAEFLHLETVAVRRVVAEQRHSSARDSRNQSRNQSRVGSRDAGEHPADPQ